MSIDREGATSNEINSTLGLVGLHHREVEDHRLALPQRLNGPRHFIEAAGFHHIHLGHSIADAGHADHVGSRQITTQVKRVGVSNGGQCTTVSLQGALVLVILLVVVGEIIQFAIEIVIASDDGTETGDQRHLGIPLGLNVVRKPCPWIPFSLRRGKSIRSVC